MMPLGSERAFGRNYSKIQTHRPCILFRETGNKKVALERKNTAVTKKQLITLNIDDIEFGNAMNICEPSKLDIALEKARAVQTEIIVRKKIRSIKIIDASEVRIPVGDMHGSAKTRASLQKCKAITMSNKPCPFKAVCGAFCRRHKIV
jgi:hypothetical protein